MVMLLAACTPGPGSTPAESPFGDNPPADLAQIPQPVLAQIDLSEAGPAFDGSGRSFSYDSNLDPATTIRAYVSQLLRAGFRESTAAGLRQAAIGIWRVFVGPQLTVWIQVGMGPPTSLLVVVQPTGAADLIRPYPRPVASVPSDVPGAAIGSNPKPASKPAQVRRPDPPHAGGAVAGGSSGESSGGAVAGGDGSGTGSGTGTGTGTGTGSGNGAAGGAGTGSGGSSTGGSSSGGNNGGYGGSGPRP